MTTILDGLIIVPFILAAGSGLLGNQLESINEQ